MTGLSGSTAEIFAPPTCSPEGRFLGTVRACLANFRPVFADKLRQIRSDLSRDFARAFATRTDLMMMLSSEESFHVSKA